MDEIKFSEWIEEMTKGSNFPRQKLPTHNELSSALSVKSFIPVLEYLVKHARPSEECQHIKLNLKNYYRRKHLSEERKMSETQKQLVQLKLRVEEAEKEVQTEADDLKRIVEEEEKLIIEENNTRCHVALLQISSEELEEKMKVLRNRTMAISEMIPKTKPSLSPQEESINHNAAMEDLEFILQNIIILKKNVLDNQKEEFHEKKVEIWKLVEELIERYSASNLNRALSCKISQEVNLVAEALNSVNLLDDAKALNLEYQSNGVFVDILNPHGILETVESMLVQMSAKHIQKHFAYCKQKEKVKLTSESLKAVSNNVESVLNEQFKDISVVSAITDLLKTTVRIAGLKASLTAASALTSDLEKRAETAKKGKELITEKYNRIHNFQENVKRTVTELQSLVFASHTSLDELENRRSNMAGTVEDKLKNLTLPTPFLKGAFSNEIEAILNIPPQTLKTFSSDHFTPGHSIGPIEDSHSNLADLSCLVPFVSPWENIIEMVRQKKLQLRFNEDMLSDKSKEFEKMMKTFLNENLSIYEVKAMQQKVKLHDEQLEAEMGPVLDKSVETNEDVEDVLTKLNTAIDDWWTQPGTELKKYIEEKY
ncbi:hypothetical protein Anas_12377 [Armadillidium nasatum]|uniref:HAUS augmin-like complex subunit 5 n=1 Tax=Armadillidium nasatum TaxID=96803 RepID=A0A5N5SPE4_9CRUS|nr:hypothetical protein Anas_12377 [Armadillidium nasatum]